IVHNRRVVEELREEGAVFVPEIDDVPDGAVVIFSAHGVAERVVAAARQRGLRIIDATCPLVTKVHREVKRHIAEGRQVIMIGHRGHPEVEGTMGQAPEGEVLLVENEADVEGLKVRDPERLAFVTQTTLSVDDAARIVAALKKRFPHIVGPRRDDICYATTNRQAAVKAIAARADVVLIVGSPNSSNSNRLREIAEAKGARAYLIEGAEGLREAMLEGARTVGISAGASAPEEAVQELIATIRKRAPKAEIEEVTVAEEQIVFPLPPELRGVASRPAHG
ncbi:MAG: 4-hydroxy-3-methylbut-2-enyl diphosphate reductase, partial [Zetaproteobacteria bacterium]